jgi:signal transduction histidine kinase
MKLTTKVLLIFLSVSAVAVGWLLFYAIPHVRSYLQDREVHYAKSYLEMASDETRGWLTALDEISALPLNVPGGSAMGEDARAGGNPSDSTAQSLRDAARRRLFKRLNDRFAKFYFHESGRLFVINQAGEFVTFSDQIMRGRAISNRYLFQDGSRNKLIQEILRNRADFMQQHRVLEVSERNDPVEKLLFVKYLVGTEYFVCISVNEDDLLYSANLAAGSLTLMVIIILLTAFLLFNFFYARIRQRFDLVVENANLIEHGNYDIAINDKTGDELSLLAGIIDKLAADLRQKSQLENQLRQAQKMEMVGTLASGIAHDFNNILAGITSSIDLIKREIAAPSEAGKLDMDLVRTSLGIASDCALRARDTVARMLSFSRVSEKDMRLLDLNRIMYNLQQICQSSFDKRVHIQVKPLAEPAVARADRSQLEQAILNVCINARDAMADGGKLTLAVELIEKGARNPRRETPHDRAHFRISVSDTGCGIEATVLARVFEPFFTTKKRGSGLGLPMVYKIADEHGGWVEVESQVGVGTTFHIYLPKSTESLPLEDQIILAPGESRPMVTQAPERLPDLRGTGTILVVDDEPHMLRLTQDILARLGYQPLGASGGHEAIATFKENAEKIDAVILDLLLPEMTGAEVFEAIRAIRLRCCWSVAPSVIRGLAIFWPRAAMASCRNPSAWMTWARPCSS